MSDNKKSIFSVATEDLGFPEFLPKGESKDDVFVDDESMEEIRMDTAVPEVNFEEASHHTPHISDSVKYVGVNDHNIDLFEGMYDVPNGIAYNSYVIIDEKIAVMDTVDANFVDVWLEKVKKVIGDRLPEYLVVHHMEPDHSAGILKIVEKYPNIKIVASAAAFPMMKAFLGEDFADNKLVVKEGDILELGVHKLNFVAAPMVHWPEVLFSYEASEKILFSADAFGKFGALDISEDWACEARRYYFGIVGKFGTQVQNVLKKAAGLDIKTICPLHGPILKDNLSYYFNLYDIWSSYGTETPGTLICYTSVYGHTKKAVEELAKALEEKGCPKVVVNDLARCDMAEAVEDAFRYGKIILATTTYNTDIFPFMREFIHNLTERNYSNRKVGLVENGAWAPNAANTMKKMMENSKNVIFADTIVKIKGSLSDENRKQIDMLAEEMK